jgi:hypothetical protein
MSLTIDGNLNQAFIGSVVSFFCDALGISIPKNLLIFTDETIALGGACYQNDHDDYMIVLKDQDMGQMIVTLAHELTHVKQYVLDDLKSAFTTEIPYRERWWEVEAYEKEVELTKMLIEAVENGKM